MKKVINFRPLFLSFIFMLFGGLILPMLYFLPVYAHALILIALLTPLVVFLFVKKTLFKYFAFALVPLILVLSVGVIRADINKNLINNCSNVTIVAVCTDKYNTQKNYIEVRNLVINGKKVNRKVVVYVEGGDVANLKAGTALTFKGNFTKSKDLVSINTGTFGYASVNLENATISNAGATIFETFRSYIRSNLNKIENTEISEFCYAVLFGDRLNVAESTSSAFSASGTAHLLAISGLHVGFLLAFLMFILKLCKAGRKTKLIVPTIVFVLLMFLCTFNTSVVRASIIAIVYLVAQFLGREKDQLSTLSFAGLLILIVNPFVANTYGFLLSFASVFAIICLAGPLAKLFKKIKLGNSVSNAFATICAVNLATIPLTALMNNELNLICLISNIFLIPLFSLFYLILLTFVVLTAIMPFAAIITKAIIPFYYAFSYVQSVFTAVPVIVLNSNMWLVLTVILLIFVLGKFVMIGVKPRAYIASILAVFVAINLIVTNITYTPNKNEIYFDKYNYSIVTCADGTTIAVTDYLYEPLKLKKQVHALQIKGVSAVVYTGECDLNKIESFLTGSTLPLIMPEPTEFASGISSLYKYDNLHIVGNGISEAVLVKKVFVYGFTTKNVSSIILETGDAKLLFTEFIKSNKAVSDLSAVNADVIFASRVSGFIDEWFNSGTVVSETNFVEKFNSLVLTKDLKVSF